MEGGDGEAPSYGVEVYAMDIRRARVTRHINFRQVPMTSPLLVIFVVLQSYSQCPL
jgi:hypothetical protein